MRRLQHRPGRILVSASLLLGALGLGAVGLIGVARADPLGVTAAYTGCLSLDGTLSRVAIGDAPLRACRRTDIQVSWSQVAPRAPKVCLVANAGGMGDQAWNQRTWEGLIVARDRIGVEIAYREAASAADYRVNIDAFVGEGCDLIITPDFSVAADTAQAACDYPGQWFAQGDMAPSLWEPWSHDGAAYNCDYSNVRGLAFAADEAAFLAGYLAAGATETHKVGAYGGAQVPAVTLFMDGFAYGVRYFNTVNGTDVQVVGWDPDTQTGVFAGDFNDPQAGAQIAMSMYGQGADIVFPVAGLTALGTADAAQDNGFLVIGNDFDQYLSAPEYGSVWLTSVMKNMDMAAYNSAQRLVLGSLDADPYVGTLANGGVGLAPFHENASRVPVWLEEEIQNLKVMIGAAGGLDAFLGR